MCMKSIIKNIDLLSTTSLRKDALTLASVGYDVINTRAVIHEAVTINENTLTVSGKTYPLSSQQKIWVVGAGKCAIEGAAALEDILEDRLAGGVVIDVSDSTHCLPLRKIECFIGTHPYPSEKNEQATRRIVGVLSSLTKDDIVIEIVSGGGSTLLCLPNDAMTCDDEAEAFKELTDAGATITDLDTIRKHISMARGGWLAYAAYPARLVGLIFSDVPGNDISVISSGPTVKDTTTTVDAERIIDTYKLHAFSKEALIETPKEDYYFAYVQNTLLVTNERALARMKYEAEMLGYTARIVTDKYSGEARDMAKEVQDELTKALPGSVLLYGGESTVTLGEHSGKGGRNLEMALAGLSHIGENEIIIPFSTDGHDNTDYAGAVCDILTKEHAKRNRLLTKTYLQEHRSYDFFTNTKDALITGYTGSNVSDIILALKARAN